MKTPYYNNKAPKSRAHQLSAYSSFAMTILAAGNVHGQVFYNSVTPDILIDFPDDVQYLDMNGDGIDDFRFVNDGFINVGESGASSFTIQHMVIDCYLTPLSGNKLAQVNSFGTVSTGPFAYSSNYRMKELVAGDIISADLHMENDEALVFWAYGSYGWTTSTGLGVFEGPKFAGVSLLIDGQTHYGWIRLSTNTVGYTDFVTKVIDFAYEETPGVPITAGVIPTCLPPVVVGAAMIGANSALLEWVSSPDADYYEIQIRALGEPDWFTRTVPGTKSLRYLRNLECDTDYEWRIRKACTDGSMSAYSYIQNFVTTSCRLDAGVTNSELHVYPNPASNSIFVEQDVLTGQNAQVYDVMGRLVLELGVVTEQTWEINIEQLTPGMYILRSGQESIEFIKQ